MTMILPRYTKTILLLSSLEITLALPIYTTDILCLPSNENDGLSLCFYSKSSKTDDEGDLPFNENLTEYEEDAPKPDEGDRSTSLDMKRTYSYSPMVKLKRRPYGYVSYKRKHPFDSIGYQSPFSRFIKRSFDSIGHDGFASLNFQKRFDFPVKKDSKRAPFDSIAYYSGRFKKRHPFDSISFNSGSFGRFSKKHTNRISNPLKKRSFDSIGHKSTFNRFVKKKAFDSISHHTGMSSRFSKMKKFDSISHQTNHFGRIGAKRQTLVQSPLNYNSFSRPLIKSQNYENDGAIKLKGSEQENSNNWVGPRFREKTKKAPFDSIAHKSSKFGGFSKKAPFDSISFKSGKFKQFSKRQAMWTAYQHPKSRETSLRKKQFDSINYGSSFGGFG